MLYDWVLFPVVLTADAALLKPDYTDVELIYSRDKYREESAALWRGREQEAWTAMSRKRKREDSGRDDSKRQAIGFVEQVSHQKLAITSLNATCPGIFFFRITDVLWNCCKTHLFLSELSDENWRRSDVIVTRSTSVMCYVFLHYKFNACLIKKQLRWASVLFS